MKKTSSLILGVFLAMILASCVKKAGDATSTVSDTPDSVVKKFVEISATVKEDTDRQKLMQLCQGEMRRAFERMTPEAFRVAYMSNAVKIKEIKILNSTVTDAAAKVSYQITLDNPHGTDPTQEINSREVELVQSGGAWLIDNIKPHGSDQIAFTRGMIF
jgi:PBP1b-binding outer membrane lipoprotein LpoB